MNKVNILKFFTSSSYLKDIEEQLIEAKLSFCEFVMVDRIKIVLPIPCHEKLKLFLINVHEQYRDTYAWELINKNISGIIYNKNNWHVSHQPLCSWVTIDDRFCSVGLENEYFLFYLVRRSILIRYINAGIEINFFNSKHIKERAEITANTIVKKAMDKMG
ncbi:MAG: hypothetical protein ACFCUX_10385 [Candidatus Methylacidiphilales bacterium]